VIAIGVQDDRFVAGNELRRIDGDRHGYRVRAVRHQ
jgi:hypothetical protein